MLPARLLRLLKQRPHLKPAIAGPRARRHQLQRDVQVVRLDDPEACRPLLRLDERAVGEHRLLPTAVDHGRDGRVRQTAGEDPVPARMLTAFQRNDRILSYC